MTPEGKKALSGFWARWHAEDEHLSSEELWQFCNLLCVRVAELEAQVAEARDIVKKWAARVRQALIDEILAEAKILNAEHPQSRTLGDWDSLLNEPNDWLERYAPKG